MLHNNLSYSNICDRIQSLNVWTQTRSDSCKSCCLDLIIKYFLIEKYYLLQKDAYIDLFYKSNALIPFLTGV